MVHAYFGIFWKTVNQVAVENSQGKALNGGSRCFFNLRMTVSKDSEVDGRSGHCGRQSTRTLWTTVNQDAKDDSQPGHYGRVNQDTMDDSQPGHYG